MKIGIVDVGGGYRGVYAAGVLDTCLKEKIHFDVGIGVSAGSVNLISFAAGQLRRNLRFYTEFGLRKACTSTANFLTKGSFIDLDYAYGTLSNSDGEDPLDYDAFAANPMEFYVVATDAKTGQVQYFDRSYISRDHYDVMKASCALPGVCHPYSVGGVEYFDGALGDPVPVQKAFDLGCDRVVVILTKPVDFIRTAEKDERMAYLIHRNYPNAAQALRTRARRYNEGVALAREYAARGKVLIVAPSDTCGCTTLTRDPDLLKGFYRKGLEDGFRIRDYLADIQ